MTIQTLVLIIGFIALLLTGAVGFGLKKHKNWLLTYFQNFCGVLFVFSGIVKAVDPWGTAFKMQQYFAEFEFIFEPTWFSFLSPLFPWLSSHSLWFSITMIILEILLGIMLLLGSKVKLTSWAFLLLVAFFTVLTGFTFLTGYVPPGENFFQFGSWTEYNENYMRVTDCGCFGDFIKLEPRISFYKDIFLLIPSLLFVFRYKKMHQLFSSGIRTVILGASFVFLLIYCVKNSIWNIPSTDFRPFKEMVNVKQQKEIEEEAEANIQILGWKLKNKESNQIVELSNEVYMKEWKSYPKSEWEVVDQIQSKPTVEKTKISDFILYDAQDNDITNEFLTTQGYHILLVADHLALRGSTKKTVSVPDTMIQIDTTFTNEEIMAIDTVFKPYEREEEVVEYQWKSKYLKKFEAGLVDFVNSAAAEGIPVRFVIGGASGQVAQSFVKHVNMEATVLIADDILLKTIIRSNPGITLWRDGTIQNKWHYSKLPTYSAVKDKFMYD